MPCPRRESKAKTGRVLGSARTVHQQGRLPEAERLYRRVLESDPEQPDALHLLGVLALQTARPALAIELIGKAVERLPGSAECRYNLGLALLHAGEPERAADAFRSAVGIRPDYAEAHNNLANVLAQSGVHEEAIVHYRAVLRLRPGHAGAHTNLAALLGERGEVEEAVALCRRCLELEPDRWENRLALANALRNAARLPEAIDEYRAVVAIAPRAADAHHNLGATLKELGDYEGALRAYRDCLAMGGEAADTCTNVGNALRRLGRLGESEASLRRAIEIDPRYAQGHHNLGLLLRETHRYTEAAEAFGRATTLDPGFTPAQANLGVTLMEAGRSDDAVHHLARAVERMPDPAMHSTLILAMNYRPASRASDLLAEARRWHARYAAHLADTAPDPDNAPDPDRRLRIGYVSPDFRRHPVGYFFTEVIDHHDRDAFEVLCFSGVEKPDELTRRIRGRADAWHETAGLDHARLAGRVRESGVDVLVELAGHTAGNRLPALAYRPAPVQICGGGHYGTTGVADYLLADAFHVPPGSDALYSETPLRLPDGYVCYAPPDNAPLPSGPPVVDNGYLTFGSYNNRAKVNPDVVSLWARVMNACPGSRLRMQTHALGDEAVAGALRRLFAEHGIAGDRIELAGAAPHAELLANYALVDVALDPFPYSGGLTTCEALWMGVPVITMPGASFASRHAASHLSVAGLTGLIAAGPDAYVDIAKSLAEDRDALVDMRAGLRRRVAESALCDSERYTRNLEIAYRGAWRDWCARRRRAP